MPMKKYNPTTPTRRFTTSVTRDEITRERPEKSLGEGKKRSGGRNSEGLISSRFRGGGAKEAYRVLDFKRGKAGIPAKVAFVEYQPNRTPPIGLLQHAPCEKRHNFFSVGLAGGRTVNSGP